MVRSGVQQKDNALARTGSIDNPNSPPFLAVQMFGCCSESLNVQARALKRAAAFPEQAGKDSGECTQMQEEHTQPSFICSSRRQDAALCLETA